MTERHLPEYRPMITGDIEGYSRRTDPQQAAFQRGLVGCFEPAALAAELSRPEWLRQPSGDGEFSVLPPTTDLVQLTDVFLREFDIALAIYNRRREDPHWTRMRVRLALHVGPIHIDGANGFPGGHGVQVNRLADAPALRAALGACPGADLAVIVSDRLYDDYVAQGYGTLRPEEFRRVRVQVKTQDYVAYVHVPNHDVHGLAALDEYDVPRPAAEEDTAEPGAEDVAGPTRPRTEPTTYIAGSSHRTAHGDINEAHRDINIGRNA